MTFRIFLFVAIFAPFILSAQTKEFIAKPDAVGFLRDIMGAKYSKSDKSWVLPRTGANQEIFDVDAEGGLFVGVDTILQRNVGEEKEAWILFTVEGYMFNFARLVKTPKGWQKKAIYYRFHEGAHGNYGPEQIGFEMIAQKTFISVKEYWFKKGVTTRKWQLFDPFTRSRVGIIELDRTGEKKQQPDAYQEYKTSNITMTPTDKILPDIILTQALDEKPAGKKAEKKARKVRYSWVKDQYIRAKD
ncbi:MAG: hypothetical protein IT269_01290 [Saprospiraceae bacterium]|nr:hypothetical protein [Saprospiraceae bacterium]